MMLISSSLLRKSVPTLWCFALLLLATTTTIWMPTVEAVTQLNGFNLENDEQGSVRIRLNTEQPVQVEEQRQQGIYKLILKNTAISSKMKKEGLPVVMDAQGKYIGRATQLSNNQVSITIPNGVELHHQVQVIGGAISPFASLEAPSLSSNQVNPFYTEAEVEATPKGVSVSKKITHHHASHQTVLAVPATKFKPVKLTSVLHSVKKRPQFLSSASTKASVKPSVPVVEETTIATGSNVSVADEPASALVASQVEPSWLNQTETTYVEQTYASIMKTGVPIEVSEEEQLPKVPVFDGQWLSQRFLPENTPELPMESEPLPLLPIASIAVSFALAMGLEWWVKQNGYAGKLLSLLSFNTKEIPLAAPTVSSVNENNPSTQSISLATDKVIDSLFGATIKQQLVSTPPKLLIPSLQAAVAQFTPAQGLGVQPLEQPVVEEPEPEEERFFVQEDPPLVASKQSSFTKEMMPSVVTPKVQLSFQVASASTPKVNSGSALQTTLVQAIKKSEKKNEGISMQRRPAPTLVASSSTKGDFRSITQRFSNKKFQGVY